MPANPLIINNWQTGVADSPYLGFGMMKLVDIESFPGALKVQKKTTTLFHSTLSVNFTAATSDIITLTTGTAPDTGTAVTVSSSGTLPAGLAASTNYFVINLSSSTIKLATTIANANAGTAIDITDTGSGTHTIATVNPGTIRHITKDYKAGTQFWLDSNGRVWYLTSGATRLLLLNGNTTTAASGQGMAVFTNSDASATYLFVFRNAVIDVVNVLSGTQLTAPSWTSAWKTMNTGSGSSNSHHAIVGQDNIIYYCDDRYVGSIREIGIFDPSSAGTFTWTSQALDLPNTEIAQWLEQLGPDLLIAGNTFNKIYPWDRISDSFRLPITVPENSIKKMVNAGGLVYILAGVNGNIYSTQGSYTRFFKKIPTYLMNTLPTLQANPMTWGGIGMRNGALIVGAGGVTTSNSGVYLIYPDGRLLLDNIPSTGAANVTAIFAESDFYYLGYASGGDYHDPTSGRYASLEAVVQTQLYSVATKTSKATYSTLEVQMTRPYTGTVRVSYRTDTVSSFTTLATFTGDGVVTSFESDIGLIDLENIQIQIEMSSSVEVLEVRLRP